MSPPRAKSDVKRYGRQPLLNPLKDQAAQPRGIKRKRSDTPRENAFTKNRRFTSNYFNLPSPTSITPDKERPQESVNPFNLNRKRKRSEELGQNHKPHIPFQAQERPTRKRQRISTATRAVEGAARTNLRIDTKNNDVNPIQRWVEEGSWSGGNFNQDSNMAHSLTRKRSTPSLSKHESDISGVSLREGKNPLVKSRRYEQILVSAGIYMDDDDKVATTNECKALCQTLLNADQTVRGLLLTDNTDKSGEN
ncbi:hypothetical protein MMC29_005132 [Sticta canariensis]|nr:hypothetical protein [Sticta canariensis]